MDIKLIRYGIEIETGECIGPLPWNM